MFAKVHRSRRLKRGRVFTPPEFRNRWRRRRYYGLSPIVAALEYRQWQEEMIRLMGSRLGMTVTALGLLTSRVRPVHVVVEGTPALRAFNQIEQLFAENCGASSARETASEVATW